MNMDKETYRQVVNALAVIGLTLEHADYLFDNDPKALKQVDDALLAAGIDAPLLRNRQVDRILEDTKAFNANAFENMISDPVTDDDELKLDMGTNERGFHAGYHPHRRSNEERRSIRSRWGHDRRRPFDDESRGDRRIGFVPTHHGADKIDPLDKCNFDPWPDDYGL